MNFPTPLYKIRNFKHLFKKPQKPGSQCGVKGTLRVWVGGRLTSWAAIQHNGSLSAGLSGLFAAEKQWGQSVHVLDVLGTASTLALWNPSLGNFPVFCSGRIS